MNTQVIMALVMACDLCCVDGNENTPPFRIISDFAKSLRASPRLVVTESVGTNERANSSRSELGRNIQDLIRVYTNPYEVESQRRIEEAIRLENVDENLEHVSFL